MQRRSFEEALAIILKEDQRYAPEAYFFLRQALDFSVRMLNKPEQGPARHVTGQELMEGVRLFAIQEYGPMARTVLRMWGLTRTEDFGEIVFSLVNKGVLGKQAQDKKEDFAGVYDFVEAFTAPFRPAAARRGAAARKPARRRVRKTGSPSAGAPPAATTP